MSKFKVIKSEKFRRGDVVQITSIYGNTIYRVVGSVDVERCSITTIDKLGPIAFEDCTLAMRDGKDVVVEPDLSKFDIPIGGI
jgi:hypothetical protein